MEPKKVNAIQSVDRALRILEEFNTKERVLGVTEIAKRLGLNKSTCFGLLQTLYSRGYLEQDSDTGKYKLGLKLFELGLTYESGIEIREIAKPHLRELVEKTFETVHLVIRDKTEAVYIEKVEGPGAIRMISQVGKRVHLHCTGVGKAILAFLPDDEVDSILKKGPLEQFTWNTIVDKEKLKHHLHEVRERGYCIDDEEIEVGLRCVAAPIFNHRKEVISAISVSGPTTRMTYHKINEIEGMIKETAAVISSKLGYVNGE